MEFRTAQDRIAAALLAVALAGLALGLGLLALGFAAVADLVWTLGVVPVLLALCIEILRALARREAGLDIVAALSMTAALVFDETLAAGVVAVMYAGGGFLESFAETRARREMHDLLSRAPRTAARRRGDALEEIPVEAVAPGDVLLIRRGDVTPVDGPVGPMGALLDLSALTGEAMPVRLAPGDEALSGAANAGEAFEMTAARPARDSAYAAIVRLVEEAQAAKAPMARLADRWSLGFLAATLALAGGAWVWSGDPVRAVAVLVSATPCPLILAVPVALVAGLSRAAQEGVLIKGARALEAMARVRVLILDKTGTLTEGRPRIVALEPAEGIAPEELLRLGAALDQASKHPVAQAMAAAARERGAALPAPRATVETPGEGVAGEVEGRAALIGTEGFVAARLGVAPPPAPARAAGEAAVAVALDGRFAGRIVTADPLRADAAGMLSALRGQGIGRILLATGDRADVAEAATGALPLDARHAGLDPAGKVALVRAERRGGAVMMVGDGVNDAPALAAADLGVAMGARGAAAAAEAADAVLLVDRIDRLGAGVAVARGARAIALQSVALGIGLSLLCMILAALGHLTPVEGAVLQEAIDVAAILNALRALRIRTGLDAG